MATIRQVIQYVDDVKPNAFSNATKVEWINEVEGLVQTEVLLRAIDEVETYTWEEDADTELLVRPPHDKLYRAYLTAMIDYANGEYNRYSNTVQMFNAHLGEFQRWFATVYRPADTHGEVYADAGTLIDTEWRGYYITAYGIAVKHGYQGTEAQWLEEIYGGAAAAAASAEAAAASKEAAAASEEAAEESAEAAAASAEAAAASKEAAAASEEAAEESAEAAAASELAAKDYAEHIADPVSGIVTDWLDDNITQETGYVIDKALVTEDAAADAKRTGDVKRTGIDRTNILHGLVDYGYADEDLVATSTTSSVMALGVSRRNTEITLNLAASLNFVIRLKLSVVLERSGSQSQTDTWTSGMQLTSGRKYRMILAKQSGTVTGDNAPIPIVYKVGTHSSIGDLIEADSKTYIREFTAPSEEVNLAVYIYNGTILTNARYQVLLQEMSDKVDYTDANIGKMWEKRYLIERMPFYEIDAPFVTSRPYYTKSGNNWVPGSEKPATAVLPCPKYLMVYPKYTGTSKNLYLYVGDIISGKFVPDETVELVVTGGGDINYIRKGYLFKTYESDGTRKMVILGNGINKDRYSDDFMIVGADEWPESPLIPNAWTFYSGGTDNTLSWESTTKQGFHLPEEAWVFVKDVDYALINYGIGSSASKPWSSNMENISAFFVPKDSGMALLTVNADDVVTEENVCIAPKIMDKCITSNAWKAAELADSILKKFRWTGKSTDASIAERVPITVGKEYHTIPYSGRWNGQHFVCFETTPETAANAANDEYSIFYDDTGYDLPSGDPGRQFMRSELSSDGAGRPGYGGVCSIWAALATGSPYPQSTDGFFADQNFEIGMMVNTRSGDVIMLKDSADHGAMVDQVFENGYSLYEWAPPGIIQTIHTSGKTVPRKLPNDRTARQYLRRYNYTIASRDRSGWDTNYLDFDYEIANGSIRPWRGNKSVCSSYNKMTTPASSISLHTGIHITVHDGAETAYILKPGAALPVSVNVTGQTVVTINDICDAPGTYELWSDVSDTREYFRYFEHDPVKLRLAADGTASFENLDGTPAEDVDYAHVNTYGADTPWPEIGKATVNVIAKGKKYPGIVVRNIKCAVVRDDTVVDGAEDSWGRYPIVCTMAEEVTGND